MEDMLWRWLIMNNPLKSEHTMQTPTGELVPPKIWFERYYQDNENIGTCKQREIFLKKFCTSMWTGLIENRIN